MNEKLIKFTMPSGPGAPAADAPSKARILVADDDPVSRNLISIRLAEWGYDAIITEDGAEAMAALRRSDAPSLAILDWSMPKMDGIEICRRLREIKKLIYIILLTVHGSKESIVKGLRAGADDYLVKPFHAEELRARILVGLRVTRSEEALADRVRELEAASSEIASLKLYMPL